MAADVSLCDCFSASAAVLVLDYHLTDQLVCPEVAALCVNSRLHFSTQHVDSHSILGDISTGTFRPVVP